MPISAEKMKLYPGGSINSPEWKAIRNRILERDGHACKLCHAPNGEVVHRDMATGAWSYAPFGNVRTVKIVLTIAHFNQDTTDNRDANLAALCQRCHNIIDAPWRRRNAAATRRAKSGQIDMLDRVTA